MNNLEGIALPITLPFEEKQDLSTLLDSALLNSVHAMMKDGRQMGLNSLCDAKGRKVGAPPWHYLIKPRSNPVNGSYNNGLKSEDVFGVYEVLAQYSDGSSAYNLFPNVMRNLVGKLTMRMKKK